MGELSVHVSSGQSIKWDLKQVPCRHKERGSKFSGIFLTVFAAFWGGMPTFFLIKSIIEGKFVPGMLWMLIFTVIGAGLFLFGLNQFFTHTVTDFDGRTFRYRHKSLFGSKAWEEPLSEYEGVMSRSEYHSGGRNSSSYTLYILELLHPDEQRRIRLRQSRSSSGHRASWETYSRQLGLPALKQDEDADKGYTRRDVEDLDKSVRELAAEGKLEISFDPAAAIPDKLELNTRGDQLEVAISTPKIPIKMIPVALPIILLLPTIFIWVGFFSKSPDIIFGIVGILVGLFLVSTVIWTSITTPLVRVNRKGLHILRRTPWGETRGKCIPADIIENVRISKERADQSSSAVIVETDSGSHNIGKGLDRDTLEWLKNCILSKLVDG